MLSKKSERVIIAEEWDKQMRSDCATEIETSINRTVMFHKSFETKSIERRDISTTCLKPWDTIQAIFRKCYPEKDGTTAALNFASFTHPGGGFLKGSTAQEETLCLKSDLYQILSYFDKSFYEDNRKVLSLKNHGLYTSKALYTPDVKFYQKKVDYDKITYCDILTCAAPNCMVSERFGVSHQEVVKELISRIDFLLSVAVYSNVEVLILGAFGCGAFHNDPFEVATVFDVLLNTKYRNVFKEVLFAIPDDGVTRNYEAFNEVIIKHQLPYACCDIVIERMKTLGYKKE